MSKPTVKIFDVDTQEEFIREMTDEEYAQYLLDQEEHAKKQAEFEAQQAQENAAKEALHAKLADMGITPELIEVIKKIL